MDSLIIAALAAGFVVAAVDFWQFLPFWRAIVALASAAGALICVGTYDVSLIAYAPASAFLAVILMRISGSDIPSTGIRPRR